MTSLLMAFGSRARGEADYFSDTDLLKITSPTSDLEIPASNGVLSISRQGIIHSSQNGSLFLKHVFEEGRLLAGSEDDLYALKRLWRAKVNYEQEIEENRDLLTLLENIPQTNIGVVAAVDILICALRSILIRRLAQDGVYLFSWAKLAEVAVDRGLVHAGAARLIRSARQIKNLYRNGETVIVEEAFVHALINAAHPVLGSIFLSFNRDKNVRRLPERCVERSYKQLRAIELTWATLPNDPSTQAWLPWIRDPRSFSIKCGY